MPCFMRFRAIHALASLAAAFSLVTMAGAALAQEKAAAALIPVSVELVDVSQSKLPFIMAADYGIYERHGLKVRQYITPSAANAIKARGVIVPPENIGRERGDINIGGGSPTMVRMTTLAAAPRRSIIATTDVESHAHIITRATIKTPADIKGKRIGYGNNGALNHLSLLLYLKTIGLDPERDVSMYGNGNDIKDIVEDRVDVIAVGAGTLEEAREAGLNDLVDLTGLRLAMPGSGVNVLTEWLQKNRDATARFMKATVEAFAMMKNDKKAAFASMNKWYGITDNAKLEIIYADAINTPRKPYPSIEGLKNMQSVFKWRAIADRTPESFVDASFVAELDKSGYIDSLYDKAGAAK